MDGARLWEAQPYYARPFSEICAQFDSVYVSFYKGIGALSGAMLVGDRPFMQRALAERHRLGGQPYVLHYTPSRLDALAAMLLYDMRSTTRTNSGWKSICRL
jgi:threonine aldolase